MLYRMVQLLSGTFSLEGIVDTRVTNVLFGLPVMVTGRQPEKRNRCSLKKEEIIMKMSLVYLRRKSPKGEKTDWLMHEYLLTKSPPPQRLSNQDIKVILCLP
ncbi:hypothetical protein GQ457_09G030010 [Hibiscus cannabinus]